MNSNKVKLTPVLVATGNQIKVGDLIMHDFKNFGKRMDEMQDKERQHAELIVTDFKKLGMYKTPVSGKVCKSYGWANDSMGEVFEDYKMYEAVLTESWENLIIVPIQDKPAGEHKEEEVAHDSFLAGYNAAIHSQQPEHKSEGMSAEETAATYKKQIQMKGNDWVGSLRHKIWSLAYENNDQTLYDSILNELDKLEAKAAYKQADKVVDLKKIEKEFETWWNRGAIKTSNSIVKWFVDNISTSGVSDGEKVRKDNEFLVKEIYRLWEVIVPRLSDTELAELIERLKPYSTK